MHTGHFLTNIWNCCASHCCLSLECEVAQCCILTLASLTYGWCICNINSRADPLATELREIKVVLTRKLPASWLAPIVPCRWWGIKITKFLPSCELQYWLVCQDMPMDVTYGVTIFFLNSFRNFSVQWMVVNGEAQNWFKWRENKYHMCTHMHECMHTHAHTPPKDQGPLQKRGWKGCNSQGGLERAVSLVNTVPAAA